MCYKLLFWFYNLIELITHIRGGNTDVDGGGKSLEDDSSGLENSGLCTSSSSRDDYESANNELYRLDLRKEDI